MRVEVAVARKTQLELLSTVEPDLAAGASVTGMLQKATRARMNLGLQFLRVGEDLHRTGARKSDAGELRSAIGRLYYAMYQAACAVVFDDYGGNDKNGHQDLPKALPQQFPNRAQYLNDLKDARLRRNEADYEPYPEPASDWLTVVTSVETSAKLFVNEADNYLKGKGI